MARKLCYLEILIPHLFHLIMQSDTSQTDNNKKNQHLYLCFIFIHIIISTTTLTTIFLPKENNND